MAKHRVHAHNWENGILRSITEFFESIEEALGFAKDTSAHSVKIYNEDGELLHSAINVNTDPPAPPAAVVTNTYA